MPTRMRSEQIAYAHMLSKLGDTEGMKAYAEQVHRTYATVLRWARFAERYPSWQMSKSSIEWERQRREALKADESQATGSVEDMDA